MNEGHLITALWDCKNGRVPFKVGTHRAFLHGNHWYPIRAVVNHARKNAHQKQLTTDDPLTAVLDLGFYIKSKEIKFKTRRPVLLTNKERLREANAISFLLSRLTGR